MRAIFDYRNRNNLPNVPIDRLTKAQRNDYIHCRSRGRDDQFLHRLLWHALETRDATDRQQGNVRCVNAERFGRKCVTEFVQHHAEKQEQQKNGGPGRTERQPSDQ